MFQTAVANADVFNYVPAPGSDPAYTSLGELPPLDQLSTALQEYNVVDASTQGVVGEFNGVSSQDLDTFGLSNQEILATGDITGAENVVADEPPAGSFFDTTNIFGIDNVYSDVVGTGAGGTNTITDTVVTPFGNIDLPTSFDAAAALPAAEFAYPASATAAGDSFVPTGTEDVNAISGFPVLDQTVSGTQSYDVDNATGSTVGSFDGVSLNDVQGFGPSDQEILVIPAEAAKVATAADPIDLPGRSIFNTVDYGHGFENVYSDVVGTGTGGTNTITDTFVTPFGDFNLPSTFDAAAATQAAEFTYPANSSDAGDSFVPTDSEHFTAIAGQPTLDQTVSGTQLYDIDNASGTMTGSFTGVSTNTVDAFGLSNQEIQVTDPGSSLDGSLFDTFNLGSGFENVYSDVVGVGFGGVNTITDTLVTPLGDVSLPVSFDAAAALDPAEYIAPGSSTAADLATALNPADFTGLLTDLSSIFDLGTLLPF